MKSILPAFILASSIVTHPAWAATPAPAPVPIPTTVSATAIAMVSEIAAATQVMNQCAQIADQIVAAKPPDGLLKHLKASASNEKNTDPKKKVKTEAGHEQYMARINGLSNQFDACGKNYAMAYTAAQNSIQQKIIPLGETPSVSQVDGVHLAKNIDAYNDAQKKLQASLINLTNDKFVQFFVHKTLLTYFVKQQ